MTRTAIITHRMQVRTQDNLLRPLQLPNERPRGSRAVALLCMAGIGAALFVGAVLQ